MNDPTRFQPGAVFDPNTEAGRAFGQELQAASRSIEGAAMHNHINPNQLDPTERRILLHALHQARALQNLLRNRFMSV
jgi:hypothetical protein